MVRRLRSVLQMPSLLLMLGLALGLVSGLTFPGMEYVAMAALASLMTFSLGDVALRGIGPTLRFVPLALGVNFLLQSTLLVGAGLLTSEPLREGWILMAAVPPAIAVVPFTAILRGDVKVSVSSVAILYLLALGLTPLIALLLLNVFVNPFDLFLVVLVLIAVPLAVSRGVVVARWSRERLAALSNLSFAGFTFLVGAANQQVVLADPLLALEALAASAVVVGGAGLLTWGLLVRFPLKIRLSMLLFSGFKNAGLAATLAIAFLGPSAVLAPTMMILFQIGWIALLIRWRSTLRPGEGEPPAEEGQPPRSPEVSEGVIAGPRFRG